MAGKTQSKEYKLDDIPCTLKTPGPFLAQRKSCIMLKKLFEVVITTQLIYTYSFTGRIEEADTLM